MGNSGTSPQPPVSRSDLVQWHIAAESSSWRLIGTRLFGLGRAGAEATTESRDSSAASANKETAQTARAAVTAITKCPVSIVPSATSPGFQTPRFSAAAQGLGGDATSFAA